MHSDLLSASRADLHIHSKHSNRPTEWFLRKIGAPESFVEPAALYAACKKRGMDFVTITDHNSIAGALEIAHLPDTFISSEITTYFPEDGCKIHCLVYGISESVFKELDSLRDNIYMLRDYMIQRNILHAIAHPLFRINDKLNVTHVEKLIVLFNRFEGVNGSRHQRACNMMKAIAMGLTAYDMEELANRHGIHPAGPTPWIKTFTGGSDDHSGLYATRTHTFTPRSSSVEEFLMHLRAGRHWTTGNGGGSLQLAHSLYHIAYCYYSDRFLSGGTKDSSLLGAILRKLAGAPLVAEGGFRARIRRPVKQFVMALRRNNLSEAERLVLDELNGFAETGANQEDSDREPAIEAHRNFKSACRLSQQLSFLFLKQFAKELQNGRLIDSFQSLSSLAPILAGIAPYLTAFHNQHKDEAFLQETAMHFPAARALRKRSGRRAWITDTYLDVNGVTRTIRNMMEELHRRNESITLLTCLPEAPAPAFPMKNFKPVGLIDTPEYADQKLVFPPFLEVLEYIEKGDFDELIISTPGPLGLVARLAGYLFGMDVKGIYHTDFPRYIHHFTDDYLMEDLAQKYMTWFYSDMKTVFVSSRSYMKQLAGWGIPGQNMAYLPHGVDTKQFNPARHDAAFRQSVLPGENFIFLYTGRLSKEKNLEPMLKGFMNLLDTGTKAGLVIVGDGPDRRNLEAAYRHPAIHFAGFLEGDHLARAYASADVFVFPSMTDTFGNVVLEAHASGLPHIVSREGGPAEIVARNNSGLLVDATRPDEFTRAMHRLIDEPGLRERLARNALLTGRQFTWTEAVNIFLRQERDRPLDTHDQPGKKSEGETPCFILSTPSAPSFANSMASA